MEIILQCREAGIKAPNPDQHSRQISRLESPPGPAARLTAVVVGWDESKAQIHATHRGLCCEWGMEERMGGSAVSNGFNRICVPPPGWSVMFIRTNLNMYLHVSAREAQRDFFWLLIQSEPPFTARYMYRHLTDISQSKFVRHSLAAAALLRLIGLEGETNDYWRRANRLTCWRGFSLSTTERGLDRGRSFTVLQVHAHGWLTAYRLQTEIIESSQDSFIRA